MKSQDYNSWKFKNNIYGKKGNFNKAPEKPISKIYYLIVCRPFT